MSIGLFGKLPQKADFVTLNLPKAILHPLEQWLEAGVAESQAALGEHWLELYLVAPIWRLWIGPKVFGHGCCGALMPSVDTVGRYFPLLLLAWNGDGSAPTPLSTPEEDWYHRAEERLLSVLRWEQALDLTALTAGLEMPPVAMSDAASAAQSCWWQSNGDIVVHEGLPPPAFYADLLRPVPVSEPLEQTLPGAL